MSDPAPHDADGADGSDGADGADGEALFDALVAAVDDDDAGRLKELLTRHAIDPFVVVDVSGGDGDGATTISVGALAAERGAVKVAQFLAAHAADTRPERAEHMYVFAADEGNTDVVLALLQRGVPVPASFTFPRDRRVHRSIFASHVVLVPHGNRPISTYPITRLSTCLETVDHVDELASLCRESLRYASVTVIGALRLYKLFQLLAHNGQTVLKGSFLERADQFVALAFELWTRLDGLEVMEELLEQPGVLDVVLEERSGRFVRDPNVNLILTRWWLAPYLFKQPPERTSTAILSSSSIELSTHAHSRKSSAGDGQDANASLAEEMTWGEIIAGYQALFRVPRVQWWMDVVTYLIFVIVFSVFVGRGVDRTDSDPTVIFVYLFGAGLVVREASEAYSKETIGQYFTEQSNVIDALVIVTLSTMASARWAAEDDRAADDVYEVSVVVGVLLVYLRLLYFCSLSSSLGPLLLSLNKMLTRDVAQFVLILGVFVTGFLLAFLFLLRGSTKAGFETSGYALGTLLSSAFGAAEVTDRALPDVENAVFVTLGVVYVLVTGVVLTNLLIAQMSHTFAEIKDESEDAFLRSRLETFREYSEQFKFIPPPLNCLSAVMWLAILALTCITTPITRRYKWCRFCGENVTNDEIANTKHCPTCRRLLSSIGYRTRVLEMTSAWVFYLVGCPFFVASVALRALARLVDRCCFGGRHHFTYTDTLFVQLKRHRKRLKRMHRIEYTSGPPPSALRQVSAFDEALATLPDLIEEEMQDVKEAIVRGAHGDGEGDEKERGGDEEMMARRLMSLEARLSQVVRSNDERRRQMSWFNH